jgi:hypothetical protein
MAARVGTGTSGNGQAESGTVSAVAKAMTSGNLVIVFVKWEAIATPNVTSVTDTAGNTYIEIAELSHASGDPRCAFYYAANITGHAANVVTANFGSVATTWRRIVVEEFSGLATASPLDGSQQTNSGTGTTYTTSNISTSQSGLVIMGVGGFTNLSSLSGTAGTPDFTIGANESDTFFAYLISGSSQTVTPGASATGSDRWVAIAQAFKDAGAGGAKKRNLAGLLAQRAMRM